VESEDFRALRVDVELHSVDVIGDESLLASLVRNLVDNAARHNRPDGWVRIRVGHSGAGANRRGLLEIENSTQPNEDASAERFNGDVPRTGNQVGRTVVQSVVDAHLGTVEWESPRAGVVLARVTLPLTMPAAFVPDRPDGSVHSTDDAT
jgi:signal transduction histidine kinase